MTENLISSTTTNDSEQIIHIHGIHYKLVRQTQNEQAINNNLTLIPSSQKAEQYLRKCIKCACIKQASFGYFGYGYNINEGKRTASPKPFKYNLMHARINLLVILYLCVIPIIISQHIQDATVAHYCFTQYNVDAAFSNHINDLVKNDTTYITYRSCINNKDCPDNPFYELYYKYYYNNPEPYGCIQDQLCQNLTITDMWYGQGVWGKYITGCVTYELEEIEEYIYSSKSTDTNCNCCASNDNSFSHTSLSIIYFVLLGINVFRLLILTPLCAIGRSLHNDEEAGCGYYTLNKHTKHVALRQYMTYLCDHPASYMLAFLYPDANQAITEAIIYNIAFPSTHFLYFNISLLYIPFIIIFLYLIEQQMRIFLYGNTTVNASILIAAYIGAILLLIGFVMSVYRWRQKNTIERNNAMSTHNVECEPVEMKENIDVGIEHKIIDSVDDEIIIREQSNCCNIWSICGWSNISKSLNRRIVSPKPNKFNLLYRWFNLIIFIYLWIPLIYAIRYMPGYGVFSNGGFYVSGYGFSGYDTNVVMICYGVCIVLNTLRLFVITLCCGIVHIDNELNYNKDIQTNKLELKSFMDYLCDHPISLFICLIYNDVNKALYEALIYNITYPYKIFLFLNVTTLYIPIIIFGFVQLSYNIDNKVYKILWIISIVVCFIGICLSAYRFRMITEIKSKAFVAKTKTELVSLTDADHD